MPVTVINHLLIKDGKMNEFIDTQRVFALALPPCGLLGGRMYRGVDEQAAVLISTFRSKSAQEEIWHRAEFKEHLKRLRPLVESSSPMFYEEAYTTGDFK